MVKAKIDPLKFYSLDVSIFHKNQIVICFVYSSVFHKKEDLQTQSKGWHHADLFLPPEGETPPTDSRQDADHFQ